ncbi:hypothetical protein [Prochlorococcus sp. MIT 1223]|uniref:hypothetical protein n=1 Tax=Prochlorococcus sp. MIT 1223 TaxID=3096217 RepID=UPI002A75DF94|nr:hypothetical protein [Prochlorococcus sp. MIT 1223]
MKFHEWGLEGNHLTKAFADIGSEVSKEEFAEMSGYKSVDDLDKALEQAEKAEEEEIKNKTMSTPNDSKSSYNYFVINDCLAQTIYRWQTAYMTVECFNKNYRDLDEDWEDCWEEVEDEDEMEEFDEPMMKWDIPLLMYVDGEPVETDDILELHEIKKQHLDPDSPFLNF